MSGLGHAPPPSISDTFLEHQIGTIFYLKEPGSARQPYHASNQADDCKSQNNGKSKRCCGSGLFDGFRRIPSRGAKKGTIGFKLSHGSKCSVSDKRNPAIVGVNLNEVSAALACPRIFASDTLAMP